MKEVESKSKGTETKATTTPAKGGKPQSKSDKPKPAPKKVTIAVMGPTGSGKTTFINLASGSQLRVGTGLESSTSEIQFSRPFKLDKHDVTLVDTPGFDDTTKSDAEILTIITNYLFNSYQKKQYLSGVIYLHRISDNRMGGAAMRSFRGFCWLCGDDALQNALIVTNMWNEIATDLGEAREQELASKDIFFKPALEKGARLRRHHNTVESAHNILRALIEQQPKPLLIQDELGREKKHVYETLAGEMLLGELAVREKKHLQELQELQEEIQQAIAEKNEQDQRELEESRREKDDSLQKVREEQMKVRGARDPGSKSATGPSLFQRLLLLFGIGRSKKTK